VIVGVTGGIGSGKTTVCRCFSKLGRTVFSADEIARRLLADNARVAQAVRRTFGADVIDAAGKVDRRALAGVVFRDPQKLRTLNAITHPRVVRALMLEIGRLHSGKRFPYVVVEAALVFEAGLENLFDVILTVEAPVSLRLARSVKSGAFSRADFLRRVRTQLPSSTRKSLSHIVVKNTGSASELEKSIRFVDRLLRMVKMASE
jgi:dephospho-CoA kinase